MASTVYENTLPSVSAKSLIVDLLSTVRAPYSVGVGALVRAGALFGLGENSMRVALARLRASGTLESAERGLYRLSPRAARVNREVVSWSRVEEQLIPWDGSYLAVDSSAVAGRDRKARRLRERAFRFFGFQPLTPALAVRPNNWRGGAAACRARFDALGAASGDDVAAPLVFRLDDLDDTARRRANQLWDVESLEASYRATTARLDDATARMPELSREAAMVESFSIGGDAVRRIALDPLLPEEIVDAKARHEMIEAMRRYDAIGKRAWRQWAGESVELLSGPVAGSGLEAVAPSA